MVHGSRAIRLELLLASQVQLILLELLLRVRLKLRVKRVLLAGAQQKALLPAERHWQFCEVCASSRSSAL